METFQENTFDIGTLVEKVLQGEEYKKLDEDRKKELLKQIPKIIKKRKINLSSDQKEQIIKELIKEEISISGRFIIKTTLSALSAVLLPIILGAMFSTQQPKYQKDTTPDNGKEPTQQTIDSTKQEIIPTYQDSTEYQNQKQLLQNLNKKLGESINNRF